MSRRDVLLKIPWACLYACLGARPNRSEGADRGGLKVGRTHPLCPPTHLSLPGLWAPRPACLGCVYWGAVLWAWPPCDPNLSMSTEGEAAVATPTSQVVL